MNEYSNNWDSLTMRDKAEMMKIAIANGITTLPEIRDAYNEFAKGGKLNNWTMQDEAGYRYWRSRLPKNLRDTNDNDYDMRAAYKAGLQPEWNPDGKSYHLGSRDPKTGRILKAPHHPTFLKALTTDAGMGYYPTMDGKGNTYTETWKGNVQYPREIEVPFKAYGGNLYGNGGSKVAHDAKYNHAVTLYQGYIDRGMTPQTALELTNQKIAEKGWTGWASGDNKKFSTPDAFMDHTVDFHERMYPDSLNVNNFNQFFNGLEEGKHKYNPAPTVYKRNLLMTRPGVKKRINEYRATQGQAPLALLYPGQEGTSLGYDIVQPDYMEPLQEQPNIAANGGVLFDGGGQKDSYVDADDRRHKILLETRDGNLYDSNGNNYTQSYLDEDNVPVVTGIMPRDTKQYYDPNTTLEFVNAASLGLLNRGSLSQNLRLASDTYNTAFGNTTLKELASSAFDGNKGVFDDPLYNTALDIAVPMGTAGLGKFMTSNYMKSRLAAPYVRKALSANNFNISEGSSNYLLDNLWKTLPDMGETEMNSLYRNAFNTGDYKVGQAIRDYHFLNKAGKKTVMQTDKPKVWYHGTPYGNFSKFNSSASNNTIGGAAALGEKGNFTTEDLQAAKNYREGSQDLYWGNRKPVSNSPFDELINVNNVTDWGDDKSIIFNHKVNDAESVVYPLYLSSSNPSKEYDFLGNSWARYPNKDELGRKWELKVVHDFPYEKDISKRVQGYTKTFTDRKSLGKELAKLKKEGYSVGDKDMQYDNNGNLIPTGWRNYRQGEYNPNIDKWEAYPEVKAINKVSSQKYKPTTNGLVQQEFDKGKDAVFLNNVKDANAQDNWAINELIFRNSNQAKLANPFTVDDTGNLISILKRDNFLNPDIRYAEGGTLFAKGGYKPSTSIKKRITDWEGSSMKTNRSFEAEANDFNKVIPAEVRSKLSPSQLDALYSYGYNVGMGNLKQRVLPTLVAYTKGKATREDVQRSMWASKDNILRGLTLRRNAEREMFGGN